MLDCALGQEIGTIYSKQELAQLVEQHAEADESDITAADTNLLKGALKFSSISIAVRAAQGRLSAIGVFHRKSILYGDFVWARRALNGLKRRFPARAVVMLSAGQLIYGGPSGKAAQQVRETPSWPRSWANFLPFIAVSPQECMGQLASSGPT